MLLKNNSVNIRCGAVKALDDWGSPKAIGPLLEALKDDYVNVRGEALKALEKIGSPAVVPLIELLNDEGIDGIRRKNSAIALGTIGDPRAVVPLIKALEDEDIVVHVEARKALSEIATIWKGEELADDVLKEVHDALFDSLGKHPWLMGPLQKITKRRDALVEKEAKKLEMPKLPKRKKKRRRFWRSGLTKQRLT